jgi:Tfp pilus assembly protein PilX
MTMSRPNISRQRGATLIISLIFLVILTLFAVSGMNTGVNNLRTANNMQLMIEAESAAQQQIEQVMNSVAPFETVAASATTVTIDANGDGYNDFTVVTRPPRCLNIQPAPGYSYEFAASAPKDTVWEVSSTASDTVFGSTATVRQGVKIRMPVSAECINPA